MRSFSDWMLSLKDDRPWLVLGKGPTFARHRELPHLDRDYLTIGLNHVCRERRVRVAHAIDADVLDEVPRMPERASFLVMPMHPHFDFKPTKRTLSELAQNHPVVREFDRRDSLLWYNLANGPKRHPGAPVVRVPYFSAEAVVLLLAMTGVRTIRTLGIDGGAKYAGAFKDIKPFRAGHKTFDLQKKPIEKTVQEFGLDFGPL